MEEIKSSEKQELTENKIWKNVDTGSTSDKAGNFLYALHEKLQSAASTATSQIRQLWHQGRAEYQYTAQKRVTQPPCFSEERVFLSKETWLHLNSMLMCCSQNWGAFGLLTFLELWTQNVNT